MASNRLSERQLPTFALERVELKGNFVQEALIYALKYEKFTVENDRFPRSEVLRTLSLFATWI